MNGASKRRLQVGDLVMLRPDSLRNFEEAELNKVYIVSEALWSTTNLPYVQLKGIYSSYPETSLIKITEET